MRSSYAMMVANVTPPLEEEVAEVDGAEEARGVTVSVYATSIEAGPHSVIQSLL